jgi:hypothetical protein
MFFIDRVNVYKDLSVFTLKMSPALAQYNLVRNIDWLFDKKVIVLPCNSNMAL